MLTTCIHGFISEQCASCRSCPHGLTASGCVRCRATAASSARRAPVRTTAVAHPPQDHSGFEIYYEPAVSGWRYRADESAPSRLSYRSAFLARKAVDELAGGSAPTAAKPRRGSKRRS